MNKAKSIDLLKVESYKKGIVLSTIFNVVNKGLVFLNSLVIAFYFGAQLKMDIYFYAFNTIMILAAFITSLNASVLIPESMRLRTQQSDQAAIRFLNFFIYLYAAFSLLICFLFIGNPVRAFNAVSGFSLQALQKESRILWLSVPLLFLIPVINLLTDIMTSYKFFTIPMIAGILNGIISILFVVFLHGVLDVLSLLAGLLLSYSLNLILLISLMKKRLHWEFHFHRIKIEKRIWKNIGFAQAGNITSSIASYAPLYLLSSFSAGIITSLNFAQQISALPTTLITNQFSAVAGIKFNETYARKAYAELNKVFVSTADFLLFILMPLAAIFFLFPTQIVTVLLRRGAFGKTGVAYTSVFLHYLGLLLPMLVINTLFSRLFMASHKIMQSFWYQIAFNIVLLVALYINVQKFGFVGYPVTLVSVHVLNLLFCYFLEKRYFGMIQYKKVLIRMGLLVLANAAVAGLVYVVIGVMHIDSDLLTLLIGIFLYLGVIFILGLTTNLSATFKSFTRESLRKGVNFYARLKNR